MQVESGPLFVTLKSTCFEQYLAHLQEDKLYYYSLWYRHCKQPCSMPVESGPLYVTLQSSTCFEQYLAHLQEDKLYYYNLWYRHSL